MYAFCCNGTEKKQMIKNFHFGPLNKYQIFRAQDFHTSTVSGKNFQKLKERGVSNLHLHLRLSLPESESSNHSTGEGDAQRLRGEVVW